jgi:uncharacterized repeat protein (TIGR03803 family)
MRRPTIMSPSKNVGRISALIRPALFGAIAFVIAVSAIVVPARAQTFTVLYTFGTKAQDGLGPVGPLVRDPAGNFYGSTLEGGATDNGTIFKLNPHGSEVLAYSFKGGSNGFLPNPGLVRDAAGNIYGTTQQFIGLVPGTLFKLSPTISETVLLLFNSTTGFDGETPQSGVIVDASGNLYGTASEGGASGQGLVYKLDPTGSETVLYSFAGGADGAIPIGGLIRDAAGNLYGTTAEGGDTSVCFGLGCGTIFKIDAAGTHTVLHAFTGADGELPNSSLTRDNAGNLYGATATGGAVSSKFCSSGCGTVFKLDTNNNLTVLHSFGNAQDGKTPETSLIRDAAGNLYGTTQIGGAFSHGTVFQISPTGTETVLHSFNGRTDGGSPTGGLHRDTAGNLYGCAFSGGAFGLGTIFKITP